MKKNLKKVISLVSAFAMAASTFAVSTSAKVVTPEDVVGTGYEQAVKELVALNVVTGYEDGTYKPENNITRAEVTKLVVAAMGPRFLENAEAAGGKDTEFSDVPGTHWAAGYVSTGVANSFIAGMGDGTFAPEENVTYAQVVKMIIAAMGYTSICEKQGGYPNGYLSVASSQGVTAGVTSNGADSIVTRGQVAQLLDNAVKIPIVAITGYSESEYTGQLVAETQIMDDIDANNNAEDYQTLLTKNHDVYVVKGRIEDTKRSESTLDAGKVIFNVEAAKNFDDTAYGTSYANARPEQMFYDGDDAETMMFVYAEALVKKDDNDEYTILTLTKAGSNEEVELSASLFDDYATVSATDRHIYSIDMYQSEDSSKTKTYKLNPTETKMYVNGVEYADPIDEAAINTYIANNTSGTIKFIDATEEAKTTTDGKIDYLLVTYYEDAVVESTQTNSSNYKVYWKEASANLKTLAVDPEDEDITCTFTKNGEAIQYTDLNEYDIVSIAYDVKNGFSNSNFYDVRVSDEKVTGKVSASSQNNNDDYYYTIGGTNYTASYSRYGTQTKTGGVLTVGTEYVVYLNAFGNIAYFDEDSTSKVMGVIDYANVDSSDTPKIRIITSAGTKVSYTVKDNSKTTYTSIVKTFHKDGSAASFATDAGTAALTTGTKAPLENLLCEYTINSNGYITSAKPLTDVKTFTDFEYKENTQKLSNLSLSSTTVVIDLSDKSNNIVTQDYSKVSAKTIDSFEDGAEYSGVVADKSNSDGTYRLAVITDGGAVYNGNTAFYVYSKGGSVYDDNQGSSVDTLVAFGPDSDEPINISVDTACVYTKEVFTSGSRGVNSATGALNFNYDVIGDDDTEPKQTLKKGDVFIYDTDSDGYATEVKILFNGIGTDYASFLKNAVAATATSFGEPLFTDNLYPVWQWLKTTSSTKSGEVGMIFGPVMDKKNSTITIGKIAKNTTFDGTNDAYVVDMNGAVEDVTITSGANVYVYDYSESKADNRIYKGTSGNITKSNVPKTMKNETGNNDIAMIANASGVNTEYPVNFIVAKTVDDDITDVLVILGDVD